MKRFVEGQDRSQLILLPDCLDDYVGEDNPVRIVDAFIGEQIADIKEIARMDGRDLFSGVL